MSLLAEYFNMIDLMDLCNLRAMGFPPEFFTILFAIPRMAGYLAHWRESLDDPDTKIMRPQQVISFL
jgi:citrate synthase